jgi:hypothetical protein
MMSIVCPTNVLIEQHLICVHRHSSICASEEHPSTQAPNTPSSTAHHLLPFVPSLSTTYATTLGSSVASTSGNPESTASPIRPLRRERGNGEVLRRTLVPGPRSQSQSWAICPAGFSGANDAAALDKVRVCMQEFVRENPHALGPSVGDPAAISITGGLGVPGRSVYSAFLSSPSDKPPFTCYECGRTGAHFSRAVRHQRQEHFRHYPFRCQGGAGHPTW